MIPTYGWFGLVVAATLVACGGDANPRAAAEAPPRPATERGRIVFVMESASVTLYLRSSSRSWTPPGYPTRPSMRVSAERRRRELCAGSIG